MRILRPEIKYRASSIEHRASIILLLISCILFLTLILSPPADADVPQQLTYQGRLTDENGAPVADGLYTLTFYLYNAFAAEIDDWSQISSVDVTNGVFSAELDFNSGWSVAANWNQQYYFTLAVGIDPEMSPRIPLDSVPYAFNASRLNGSLGPDSDIVGISDEQTLTDKTLNSPILNTPDITLPVINEGESLSATSTDLNKLLDYGAQVGYPLFATNAQGDNVLWWDGTGWGSTDLMRDGQNEINEADDFGFTSAPLITNLNADFLDGLHATEITFGVISGLTEDGTIENKDVIYLTDEGHIARADATPSATPTCRAIGFKIGIDAEGKAKIQPQGNLDGIADEDDAPLIPGASYYLSKTHPGKIVVDPPTDGAWVVKLGRALDSDTLLIDIADGVTYDSGWHYVDLSTDREMSFSHFLASQNLTAYWMFAENVSGTQHVYTRMAQDTGEAVGAPETTPSKGGSSLQMTDSDTCTMFFGDTIIQATEYDNGTLTQSVYAPSVGYVKAILIRDLGGAGGAGGAAPIQSHWAKTGDDIQNTNTGNVGIGALPEASYKLDVAGWTRSTQFCLGGVCIDEWDDLALISTGDITAVYAGFGLTGGGETGDVTLNVGAGNGIAVALDSISVDAGAGLGFSGTQLINTGVTSLSAGAGINVSGATGDITISNTGDTDASDDITGSGNTGKLARFTGNRVIGDSIISDDGTNISVFGGTKVYLRAGEQTYLESDLSGQISIYVSGDSVAVALHK